MDRSIIFGGPMIRSLIEGRKTQTRRILKPQPVVFDVDGKCCEVAIEILNGESKIRTGRVITRHSVKFAPGDRLWVRETFQTAFSENGPCWLYRADSDRIYPQFDGPDGGAGPSFNYEKYPGNYALWAADVEARGPWRSPVFMPRWASRLILVVSHVRVQRLQDISEGDAKAEGVEECADGSFRNYHDAPLHGPWLLGARNSFQTLWNSIHGPGAWAANPWIVALTFNVERFDERGVDVPLSPGH
jgi:hypothetical protein